MKEKFKKVGKTVGYVFLIMVMFAACGNLMDGDDEKDKKVTEQVDTAKEQDAKKEAEEKKVAEEKAAKEKAEKEEEKKRKLTEDETRLAEELLLADFQNTVHMAEVTFDREMKAYIFLPATPDFIMDISMLVTGELDVSHWDNMVSQFVKLSATLQQELGDGYKLTLNNPFNEENTLLIVMDGEVYYDAFNE